MTGEEVLKKVLERIKPTENEERAMEDLVERIMGLVKDAARETKVRAQPLLVGSAARGTWISGDHDLDVFLMLPPDLPVGELRDKGLEVARRVAREAIYSEERYAEHPYVHALFHSPVGEYDVDLVPCYAVERATGIRSAVDRTPFHNEYVKERLEGRNDDVRLLKQFMRAQGVYGAELKVQGFSGYLAELFVIYYGSFEGVLRAAADWRRGETVDLEEHASREHEDPLVVVDPVDPDRNVAAALSLDQMARFVDASRQYLKSPDLGWFFPPPVEPMMVEEYRVKLEERGTALLALLVSIPDLVEDVLYPQLYKSERGLRGMLEREGYGVYQSGVWTEEEEVAIILFEMKVDRLPGVMRHMGPPVFAREHAEKFREKHDRVFVEDGRYYAEVRRSYTTAKKLLEGEALSASHGKQISESLKRGYRVLQDEDLVEIESTDFWRYLRGFFEGLPPA